MEYFLGYTCSPHGFTKLTGVSRSWEAQPQCHRPGDILRRLGHYIWVYKSPAEEKNKGKSFLKGCLKQTLSQRTCSCWSAVCTSGKQWRARQMMRVWRLLSAIQDREQHLVASAIPVNLQLHSLISRISSFPYQCFLQHFAANKSALTLILFNCC